MLISSLPALERFGDTYLGTPALTIDLLSPRGLDDPWTAQLLQSDDLPPVLTIRWRTFPARHFVHHADTQSTETLGEWRSEKPPKRFREVVAGRAVSYDSLPGFPLETDAFVGARGDCRPILIGLYASPMAEIPRFATHALITTFPKQGLSDLWIGWEDGNCPPR